MKDLLTVVFISLSITSINSQQVLFPENAHNSMCFGWDIDSDDERIIVGAYGEISLGVPFSGAIYIYHFNGADYTLEERLRSPIVEPTRFAYSVAIHGDWALGAKGANISGESRTCFAFTHNATNWWAPQKLSSGLKYFGSSADVHGNVAIVGAMIGHKIDNYAPGAAVIYEYNGSEWLSVQKVNPSDLISAQSYFGEVVAISDEYAIIGAHGANNYRGAAYVYRNMDTSWVEIQKLVADDGNAFFAFGDDVDIVDSTIVIGASRDGEAGENAGAVYIYKLEADTFTLAQKINPLDVMPYDRFGRSVAIKGDYLVVGASRDDTIAEDAGAAYLYEQTDGVWMLKEKMTHEGWSYDGRYGTSVSINATHVMVGGYNHSSNGMNHGAVYIWNLEK